MPHVDNSQITPLYANTTPGLTADPNVIDPAIAAIIAASNENYDEFLAFKASVELPIPDQSIVTRHLRNLAVTSAKLAPLAVLANNIANGAVTLDKLADLVVTAAKIANGTITEPKYADGSISSRALSNGAIQTRHFDPTVLLPFGSIATLAEFDKRGVNVQKYGAKGDGITDDTQAFIDAISSNEYVLVPPGDFVVNLTSPLLVVGKTIFGCGIGISRIIQTGTSPIFKLVCSSDQIGSVLKDISLVVGNTFANNVVVTGYYNGVFHGFDSTMLLDVEITTVNDSDGFHNGVSLIGKNGGGFNVIYDNVVVRNCSTGFTINAVNSTGFITHSMFRNLKVTSYNGRYGIMMGEISENGTYSLLLYCTLDTSTVQAYRSLDTVSSAFLLGGRYNTYSNLSNFMDVGTVLTTNYGLEIHVDINFTGTYTYDNCDCNTFNNIRVEGYLNTNNLKFSNFFNNVTQVGKLNVNPLQVQYAESIVPEFISGDYFDLSFNWVNGVHGGWNFNTSDRSLTPINNTMSNAIYFTLPTYAANYFFETGRWFTVNLYFSSSVAYGTDTISLDSGNQDVKNVFIYNISGNDYVLHGNVYLRDPVPFENKFVVLINFNPVVADFKIKKMELLNGLVRGSMPISHNTKHLNEGFEEIVQVPSGTTNYTYTVNSYVDMFLTDFSPKHFDISQVDGNNLIYSVSSNPSNGKQLIVTFSTSTTSISNLRFRFRAFDSL